MEFESGTLIFIVWVVVLFGGLAYDQHTKTQIKLACIEAVSKNPQLKLEECVK